MVRSLLFSILLSILLVARDENYSNLEDNLTNEIKNAIDSNKTDDILNNVTLEGNETKDDLIKELNNTTDFVNNLTNELENYSSKTIDDITNKFKDKISDITSLLKDIKDILNSKGLADEVNDTTSKEKETYDEYVKVNNLKLYDISSTILMQQKIPPATFELKKLQKEEYYK